VIVFWEAQNQSLTRPKKTIAAWRHLKKERDWSDPGRATPTPPLATLWASTPPIRVITTIRSERSESCGYVTQSPEPKLRTRFWQHLGRTSSRNLPTVILPKRWHRVLRQCSKSSLVATSLPSSIEGPPVAEPAVGVEEEGAGID